MKFGYLEYFSMFFRKKKRTCLLPSIKFIDLALIVKKNKKIQSQKLFNCQKRKRFSLGLGKNINQPKNSP